MTTQAATPAATVQDDEPKSPLRAAVESAITEVESKPEYGGEGSPEPKVAETKPEISKSEEVVEPTPTGAEQKAAEKTEEAPQEPSDPTAKPPSSWKPAVKAKWDKVDPEVRTEVHRREREAAKAIQQSAPARQFASEFTNMIRPYIPRLQSAGASPTQAIKSLLDVDQVLSSAPMGVRAKMMAKLITDYGIDVAALDTALSGANPEQEDPTSILDSRIQQALRPLQETVQHFTARERENLQREAQQNESEIEAMAANTAKYPHFDTVKGEMADLIEFKLSQGVNLGLDAAYNLAVKMNPEAQQADARNAQQRKAQEQNKAAQRALGASLQVSGSHAPLRTEVDTSDLRATIEAAVAAHSGR